MTSIRDEVRQTISPHKFGNSRRATLAYLISLDGGCDDETGTVEWEGWFGRIGRTIIVEDSQGFVDASRYPSEEEAVRAFQSIAEDYDAWIDADGEQV